MEFKHNTEETEHRTLVCLRLMGLYTYICLAMCVT